MTKIVTHAFKASARKAETGGFPGAPWTANLSYLVILRAVKNHPHIDAYMCIGNTTPPTHTRTHIHTHTHIVAGMCTYTCRQKKGEKVKDGWRGLVLKREIKKGRKREGRERRKGKDRGLVRWFRR